MPNATMIELDQAFAREFAGLAVDWEPAAVPAPALVAFNDELAAQLGLDPTALRTPDGVDVLAGNSTPPSARPVAMAYAGHQFGGFSPRLGDGRALLLGEVVDPDGRLRDLHLKGSGRTPYSRGGDGKATVGPMLREFLIAEAMHALGVPTTRALAVVTTGEDIARTRIEPGAVLTRIAASHIRVGTFEYAARLEDKTVLDRLVQHSIDRHHPRAAEAERPALGLLDAVIDVQAALISEWMLIGFIHGVMNTDNMTISGEGIDYGPCAFMDRFDPSTVYSSIDHGGRYAYGNQPSIGLWNLTRLAETLLPLIDHDRSEAAAMATASLERFGDLFGARWSAGMRAKLGLAVEADGDTAVEDELFEDLLSMFHSDQIDYTNGFRSLATFLRGSEDPARALFSDQAALNVWVARWRSALDARGRDAADAAAAMDAVNPAYIPRNHLVHEALEAANVGEYDLFDRLLGVLRDPFVERSGLDRYASPAPEEFRESFVTFCGT